MLETIIRKLKRAPLVSDICGLFKKLREPRNMRARGIRSVGSIRHPEEGLRIIMTEPRGDEVYYYFTESEAAAFAYDILNWLGDEWRHTGSAVADDSWEGDDEEYDY